MWIKKGGYFRLHQEEQKEASKLYIFSGIKVYDILIYLSTILACLKKSVLVIDSSWDEEILLCIPRPETQQGLFYFRNVDYVKGEDKLDLKLSDYQKSYDIIFLFLPFLKKEYFSYTETIYLITDYEKSHFIQTAKWINESPKKIVLIFRDGLGGKINSRYFIKNYITEKKIVKEIYEISWDERDWTFRLYLQYEPCQHFRYLSKEFQAVLKEISMEIAQVRKKEFEIAYKKAKRGNFYCK